jgi:hypothetical protein
VKWLSHSDEEAVGPLYRAADMRGHQRKMSKWLRAGVLLGMHEILRARSLQAWLQRAKEA